MCHYGFGQKQSRVTATKYFQPWIVAMLKPYCLQFLDYKTLSILKLKIHRNTKKSIRVLNDVLFFGKRRELKESEDIAFQNKQANKKTLCCSATISLIRSIRSGLSDRTKFHISVTDSWKLIIRENEILVKRTTNQKVDKTQKYVKSM